MRILPTVVLSAAIASVGCTTTGRNAKTSQNSAEWEQSIKSKLASDPKMAKRKINVSADASKNQVTLSGTVYSKAERMEAVNDAEEARPGVGVVDKIEVKPREIKRAYTGKMVNQERERAKANGDKLGNSLEDARIHTKIDSNLIPGVHVPAQKINVDVVNGVVTLRGTVASPAAKAKASRVAMHTDGVKKVNNLLRVRAGRSVAGSSSEEEDEDRPLGSSFY